MEPFIKEHSFSEKIHFFLYRINKARKYYFALVALVFILGALNIYLHLPPTEFPVGQIITINTGESLQNITENLYNAHIVRSPFVFRTTVILLGGEKKMKAGDYLLDQKEGPADIAYRLVHGKFHLEVAKITIPEGWSVSNIADYLSKTLIDFNKTRFINLAKSKEGYLFPDTYFVSPAAKPEKIIEIMSKTFENKTKNIQGLSTSTHTFSDIIILASILEEEARTTESRRTIAGILWKRLDLGMPLQVDSTFLYINGKNTYELTAADLKIDNPYNTYVYKGLPPTPISNPGVDAIFAAANPIESKYLYFLSSKSGDMYYATTFEQHKRNKELYLNK